ncbi:von Willebrand factor A domain-containing protein 8 [Tribolium madens]|uniref:von Willebrand factor A domain-containing protein 8 n=1 Tax=Tribolium madens TaxID=41895 RepID=UPI001CF72C63|nr:von Willebrand factor A domain-containing protein 8 [Tribolium madens]
MLYNSPANRRIQTLFRILTNVNPILGNNVRAYVSQGSVSIGEVTKVITEAKRPEYVPCNYYRDNLGQTTLNHLKWMMQKDVLGQDIFLLGPPGALKRNLAMQYLELTNREHEYVALSRDTTESDLKQRREIVKGTAMYFDQSAVRAATEGRILVLEGIEKAERNVLPVLNNLLENREMHLEDGRLLIPAARYDKLLEQYGRDELDKWKLVRVDENFRVIALGLPVPKYRGNPLDPPLRSRFQARDVGTMSYQECYQEMKTAAPTAPDSTITKLLSCAFAISSKESAALGFPDFPLDNLTLGAKILENNPKLSPYDLFFRLYPYKIFLKEQITHLESLLGSFDVTPQPQTAFSSFTKKIKSFLETPNPQKTYIETEYQNKLIEEMLQSEEIADFCIIGPRGCGKSLLVQQVANIAGKKTENIVLYQDMTARDLIQQRTTLENGDTVWTLSPLVLAALEGKIAILDGIHRIHPSTLSVLHRLVQNRELQLHDGKRLVSHQSYQLLKTKFTDAQLTQSGVLPIDPNFRIVAIGEPPDSTNWLTAEVLSLFLFHQVRTLTKQEELHIVTSKYGPVSQQMHKIIELAHVLRHSGDQTLLNLAGHLSTRQILRLAARMSKFPTGLYDVLETTFMIKFLPSLAREALERTFDRLGVTNRSRDPINVKCEVQNGVLTIGQSSIQVYQTSNLSKVPEILFYDVPQHLQLMEKLLQDFHLGQHILLVGNQGVGKNKIIDRFLQLMNRPREYIQLHRDTTVQTLTVQPTVKDGVLVYEDSPLVKAVKNGHVLVVDEADKAPTHVTCILKSLIESGQMVLSDGRRIAPYGSPPDHIAIHPDFRVVVLANRPGFPFLGNDFFGALGDLFSSHSVENPDADAEITLLRQYGPGVPLETVKKLVKLFGELRNMADQGLVSYPYSTREVVNIVKHLNKFPDSDLDEVIYNVFDFDRYSSEVIDTLGEVLEKYGFPGGKTPKKTKPIQVTINRDSNLDVSAPKHGKEDPENDPHVGGNTWAGGSGGRDTAGLGGKGGPYRLDKGHKVYQLSDEEKNTVPEHVQRAAREMGRRAFQEKLKEIGMSGYDASLYNQFYHSVERQVQSLRVILGNLQAKNKERHWTRHQTSGELDDVKLIDGLLGEKTIFRRRAEQDPEMGAPQTKPKLFRLVVDVSGSMYRFNGYDGRLDRELEAAVLVMEAFQGFADKIQYDIIGHSGEAPSIPIVKLKEPPKNNKERLDIVRIMHAHAQYCWSGDHTLEAAEEAINSLAEEDCDEGIVIVLSDANLERYSIPPSKLAQVLTSKANVSAYVVFIGGLGDQAERLTQKLPAGRAFICRDVTQLPQILKQIFSSSVINI